MSFKWTKFKECEECGNVREVRIPLIDALMELPSTEFGDREEQIAELQKDLVRVKELADKYAATGPEMFEKARRQLEMARADIERQAAKILNIRD